MINYCKVDFSEALNTLNIRKELGLNSVNDFNEAIKNANEKIHQFDNELKVSRDKLVSEKGLHKIYSAYVQYSSVPGSERDKNIKEIIYTAQQRLKNHNVPLGIGVKKLEKLIEFRENQINKLITQKTINEELLRKLNRSNEISQGRTIKNQFSKIKNMMSQTSNNFS